VRILLLITTLLLPSVGATNPDDVESPPTLEWPGETRLQVAPSARVEFDRPARRINLASGIIELSTRDQPVTIVTERFTATLRHGEAWVRVDDERATLWLKRGEVALDHASSGRTEMTLPMTFVEARGRTAPTPPLPVSRARAEAWSAAEAHTPPTAAPLPSPVATMPTDGGPWVIQVASLAERAQADALKRRLEGGGVAAQIVTTEVNGDTRYRVRINGFDSREEAERFAADQRELLRTDTPWITCIGDCAPRSN
jgi:hypothetical protein